MKQTIGFVAVFLILMGAGVASAEVEHASTGVLVAAGPGAVTLLENGRRLTLVLGDTTAIFDDLGQPLSAAGLGPGDYVREECTRQADGQSLARRITVLRPAWRALGSPES
jgi:hypothetical protein